MSSSPTNKGKQFRVAFSTASLFFWAMGLLVLLAWIFFLGILAGRGVFSEGLEGISTRLFPAAGKERPAPVQGPAPEKGAKPPEKGPRYEFYRELSGEGAPPIPPKAPLEGGKKAKGPAPKKGPPPALSVGSYTVQVASLASERQAVKLVTQLRGRGYRAYAYGITLKGKTRFRVRCGVFKDRKEADRLQRRLAEEEKLTSFVARVENAEELGAVEKGEQKKGR